jgi:hypothetical protein
VAALARKRLVEEVAVQPSQPSWRTDDDGGRVGYRITAKGLEVLGVAPDEPAGEGTVDPAPPPSAEPRTSGGQGTAAAIVLSLIDRPDGATIDELTTATGWQAHSVRAVLSGLRKAGKGIDRSREERGSVYRLASDPTATRDVEASA